MTLITDRAVRLRAMVVATVIAPHDGRLHREYDALERSGHDVSFLDAADPPPTANRPRPVHTVAWRARRAAIMTIAIIAVLAAMAVAAALAWLSPAVALVFFVLVVAGMAVVISRRPWLLAKPVSNFTRWASARAKHRGIVEAVCAAQPDVVIVSEPDMLDIAVAIKRRCGAALVYDAHEFFDDEEGSDPARTAWVKAAQQRAAGHLSEFVTVNPYLADAYAQRYPAFPNPVVVTNAVDGHALAVYDGRLHRAAGVAPDASILLFHGGLAPDRGLETVVAAAALLAPSWTVVLMGQGRLAPALRAAAGPRVRFLDPVPNAELALWLQGAALGIIPYGGRSFNQIYCSPNKLWEFPAAGVPVLARGLPFLKAVVEGENIGWTFQPEGAADAVASVVNALTPLELAEVAKRARAFGLRGEGTKQMDVFVKTVERAAQSAGRTPPSASH